MHEAVVDVLRGPAGWSAATWSASMRRRDSFRAWRCDERRGHQGRTSTAPSASIRPPLEEFVTMRTKAPDPEEAEDPRRPEVMSKGCVRTGADRKAAVPHSVRSAVPRPLDDGPIGLNSAASTRQASVSAFQRPGAAFSTVAPRTRLRSESNGSSPRLGQCADRCRTASAVLEIVPARAGRPAGDRDHGQAGNSRWGRVTSSPVPSGA